MKKILCGTLAALGTALVCVCAYTIHGQPYSPAKTAPLAPGMTPGESVFAVRGTPEEAPPAPEASAASVEAPLSAAPSSAAVQVQPAPALPPAPAAPEAPAASEPAPDGGADASVPPDPASSSEPETVVLPPVLPDSESGADEPDSGPGETPDAPESGSDSSSGAPDSGPSQEGGGETAEYTDPVTGLARSGPLTTRPAAVMIENMQGVSQRGLQGADLVFETATENAITRLLAVYSDYTQMPEAGPVCALRAPFLQVQLPLGALGIHAGATEQAVSAAAQYGAGERMLDGQYLPELLTLDEARSESVSIEYCWFTGSAQLQAQEVPAGGETPALWAFGETAPFGDMQAEEVYVRFSGYANSGFSYDAARGVYVKDRFGAPHLDENTGEALTFDNLLILFGAADAVGGDGYYMRGGRALPLVWSKPAPDAPFAFTTAEGQAVPVVPGRTYAALVDAGMREFFRAGGAAE